MNRGGCYCDRLQLTNKYYIMNLRRLNESDCLVKRYAKKVKTKFKDCYGEYACYGMAYFADKECKGRCVINPYHTIRKSQAQVFEGAIVWCEVIPGMIERHEAV